MKTKRRTLRRNKRTTKLYKNKRGGHFISRIMSRFSKKNKVTVAPDVIPKAVTPVTPRRLSDYYGTGEPYELKIHRA